MINPQASELNKIIKNNAPSVYAMLSKRGRAIFFPKKGILSQTAEAKGKNINATIGSAIEEDGSPFRLPSLESQLNIDPGLAFPYAPSYGRLDLRQKWKEQMFLKNPSLSDKNISLPITTNALTHALSITGYLFVDEGNTIITPNPHWINYNLIFANGHGAKIDTFYLFKKNTLNLDALRKKLTSTDNDKKILLLNFPSNPVGCTPTLDEAKTITGIIKETAEAGSKIIVICDDAYFGLIYEDGIEKQSLFSWLADIHENVLAVKIDGATKEEYAWGFRIGFITFGIKKGNAKLYGALEAKTAGAIRGSISNAPHLSQSLLLNASKSKTYGQEKQEKFNLLKLRYLEVRAALTNRKYKQYFTSLPFNSGYFMCVKLNQGLDAEKVRQTLLAKYDTGVIAMGNLLRIAYSSVARKDIKKLFDNIYAACAEQELTWKRR